ncbi:MAG: [LysW]-aminoadipate kinase [Bacteroidetes bacterium]|nr:[LysW]-aminoadipate kinase [Bacteroidota bacterium]
MNIVKIGGGKGINTEGIISDLAAFEEKYIIIHGANAYRDELAEKLNTPKKVITSVKGYSSVFTDESALDVLMMAYAGLRNTRIVEMCQQNGINAIGLTGIDGKIVQGKRNSGIRVHEEGKLKLVRDFSGKPQSVNISLLTMLLENGYVPVLTVPIVDENGYAINSENDDIVVVLNEELKANRVFQFIEAPGLLENSKDESSLINHISSAELLLKEALVEGRMKRKIHALNKLLGGKKTKIIIADGRVEHPFNDALNGKGTTIQ